MYQISNIADHRQKKLNTLLQNETNLVISDFRSKFTSLPQLDHQRIEATLTYALKQTYGSHPLNKYYVTHPIRIASFLLEWMDQKQDFSTETILAALIHNAVEKDLLSKQEIALAYGDWTADTISVLTQDREALKLPSEKLIYYQHICALSPHGQLIKFFDKLDNLYAICLNPDANVRMNYIDEIQIQVRPIAVNYYPEILPYFDALIVEMRDYGYYQPA